MLELFSPAKINLFLKILGKRLDGYHELSSLFQTVDLGDRLFFQLHDHDLLTCNDPSIPTDESNLVLKATRLFRLKTGIQQGVKIYLEKNIPMQAGLGGGSGNAATALWAFNQLTGNRISTHQLQNWSAEIGSDIPFFFSQGTAYCTGRGERVHPLAMRDLNSQCWIVKPSIGLSTPEVYQKLKAQPLQDSDANTYKIDLELALKGSFNYLNALEEPAFAIRPELKMVKELLQNAGFSPVLMSGSGSAFFCWGEGKLPDSLKPLSYPVKFLNRSLSDWY